MTYKGFSEKTCKECKFMGEVFHLGKIFVCNNPNSDHYQHILSTEHHICEKFMD